jgi:hypothetical protein
VEPSAKWIPPGSEKSKVRKSKVQSRKSKVESPKSKVQSRKLESWKGNSLPGGIAGGRKEVASRSFNGCDRWGFVTIRAFLLPGCRPMGLFFCKWLSIRPTKQIFFS